ncbi:Phage tail sheath protein FI [Halogranum amylolyticum]|uniref:Phage tail sheath protein FI n=1 Tax=Halogranum amylolyticum TaxID=660520 RepID=A0A1H8WFQ1_9EURY|nr:choice-of-anchor D domain-containing protein [Halogranum amylolyticum]SEP26456.1 Phage tail sheath protein FI [Halogranum amylolyticum]
MAEYLSPGVYVEEIEMGPKPIEGVSTSTVGFLGQTERGQVAPRLLTSPADYERFYGGFKLYAAGERLASTYLGYAVKGFFDNGGKRCFVGRIEAERETATGTLQGSEVGGAEPRVDFGSVRIGTRASETLTLTNELDVPIRIDGGNIGRPPTGNVFHVGVPTVTEVEPGEATSIEVTYQPTDGSRSTHTLTVPYGGLEATTTRTFEVELVGQGAGNVGSDALHVDFEAAVAAGDPLTRRVALRNLSTEVVDFGTIPTPTDGGSDVNAFSATVDPESLGPEGRTTLLVEFAPGPTDLGPLTATLTVPYEVGGAPEDLTIKLSGEAASALVASEPALDFGRVDTTGTATPPQSLVLRNRSNVDVDVDGASIEAVDPNDATASVSQFTDTGDTLTDTLTEGDESTLDVQFTAGDDSRVEAILVIPYSVGGTPAQPLRVPLVGQGPTDLAPEVLRIDMGEVPYGTTAREEVSVTNRSGGGDSAVFDALNATVTGTGGADIDGFGVTVTPAEAADGDPTLVTVTLDTTTMDPTLNTVEATLTIPYSIGGGTPEQLTLPVRADIVDRLDAATSVAVASVTAVGPGVWGRNVAISVGAGTQYSPTNPVFRLRVRYWARDDDAALARDHGPFNTGRESPVPEPDIDDSYDNLSVSESSQTYFVETVNRASTVVRLAREGTAMPTGWDVEPFWLDGTFRRPAPEIGLDDYEGNDRAGERTGLNAFVELDEISLVCAPDENEVVGLTDALVTHCETLGDRFAILQASEDNDGAGTLAPPLDSSYGAFYYPWVDVQNPETNVITRVPPGGHVAGVYARTDVERGVHKAPANERLRRVDKLQFTVTKGEQDMLNPRGVNVVRSFRDRGIRVWGARTMSSDPSWKYVNVRRLFLFLEESIDQGTQWVVFEPNNEALWARVRQTLENFLTTVWRSGALMGSSPEEAFFVRCDRSTMTQNDIDNGRLIAVIGVAPTKPAEFVVFRIGQWTADASGA